MGGNNVVCLKTRTLYLGEEMFMGGGGSFMGEIYRFFPGDIEVFSGGRYRGFFGGDKVLRGKKTRVQSPESRVQSPGSSPAFRICREKLRNVKCKTR